MKVLGWVWVAVLSAEGLVLLFPALFGFSVSDFVQSGRGTALQLIAASILFAAIFPTITRDASRLAVVAALFAAVFGWAGTWLILDSENPALAVILLLPPGFVLYMGIWMAVFVQIRQGLR